MTGINDIVEEDRHELYYIFKGPKGARAIELVYDELPRIVFNERSKSRSIEKAKLALRAYKAAVYYSKGRYPPADRWATLSPVFADTREEELRMLREIDRMRFSQNS